MFWKAEKCFFFANVIVNNSDCTQCRGTHVSFCVGGRDKGKQTAEEGLKGGKKNNCCKQLLAEHRAHRAMRCWEKHKANFEILSAS